MENQEKEYTIAENLMENQENNPIWDYTRQMAERHAKKVDDNFWLIVKKKPRWMPAFLYRSVIKNLIEFNHYKR